ncbi:MULTISPECIES: hypothetical protein [Cupriavidus]|uniref:hypothetical protein n=1 Tax=Cupriavidus TaxID=106589 RepID=UPI001CC1F030|nr:MULTISPECIES: hypothetical protein [Cupriavidus]MCA7082824.1 hypothetical protein [Cupriavidus sp. DB3]
MASTVILSRALKKWDTPPGLAAAALAGPGGAASALSPTSPVAAAPAGNPAPRAFKSVRRMGVKGFVIAALLEKPQSMQEAWQDHAGIT